MKRKQPFPHHLLSLLLLLVMLVSVIPLSAIPARAYTQAQLPSEMWDNSILRALSYTGFNLQWLKDNGKLYDYDYISGRLQSNAPEGIQLLSGIGYSYGTGSGGETVPDSSTPTGLAPDIDAFKTTGLDCVDFAAYYLTNYLPNIEGVDISMLTEMAAKYSGTYDRCFDHMDFWPAACADLAADGRVTAYTFEVSDSANNTAEYLAVFDKLEPGDLIQMGDETDATKHYAIYAGYFDGDGDGQKDAYIIHSGNIRGPEISMVKYMADPAVGEKQSWPLAFYHFNWGESPEDPITEKGFIEVYKKDTGNSPLPGAEFLAVNSADPSLVYKIGPTDKNGYAISPELAFGTWVVTETVFPDGYTSAGETSWTVTLDGSTPNGTFTINVVNKLATGKAKLVKTTTNGGSKAGWHFEVKNASGTIVGSYETDSTGIIDLDLEPGTYTVTETDGKTKYWVNDPDSTKTLTVKADGTATVTFTNQWRGQAQIVKTATNGGSVAGWHFDVKDSNGTVIGSYETDSTGIITLDLEPGTYTVTETDEESPYWENDPSPSKNVTVKAGETAKVTFTNRWRGQAQIVKTATNGGSVKGWEFTITDESGSKVGTYLTDAAGVVVIDLEPGSYTVQETDKNDPYWYCDTKPQSITIKAGQTTTVSFHNQWIGKVKINKTLANPEAGRAEGWPFTISKIVEMNGNMQAEYVATVTTGSEGASLQDLEPGNYLITEELSDDSLWQCITEKSQIVTIKAGQTAEVTFTNALRPGEIRIQKVDTQRNPLEGVTFLLEWSEDGTTWQSVTYTDSNVPQIGCCAANGLTDGKLLSDSDGLVTFTNLYPTLQYRLTETATKDGYQLLAGYAYEGGLSVENDLTASITVVNAEVFTLPMTGSTSLVMIPLLILLCLGICVGAIVYLRKREE